MSWVRLDDQYPDHPKVLKAGGDAAWLNVCAYCYSQAKITGGRIPREIVPRLSDRKNPMKLAAKLVEVGLWEEDGEDFRIHDWGVYNEESAEAKARRDDVIEKRRAAGRRGGLAKAANEASKLLANASPQPSKTVANGFSKTLAPSHPIPSATEKASPAHDPTGTMPGQWRASDLDAAWQEITARPTGGTPRLLDAHRLCVEAARIRKPPADPETHTRALVAANAEMLAEWRSRGQHHGSPSVDEFASPAHFAKVCDWLDGVRTGAKESPRPSQFSRPEPQRNPDTTRDLSEIAARYGSRT